VTSPNAGQPDSLPSDLARPAQRGFATAGYTTLERFAQVTEADVAQCTALGPKLSTSFARLVPAAGLSFASRRSNGRHPRPRGERH
jgi:hypothetical protein